jgi:hypothetical protein
MDKQRKGEGRKRPGFFLSKPLGTRLRGLGVLQQGAAAKMASRFASQIGTFVPGVAMILERDVSHTRRKAHDSRKIAEAE